MKQLQGTWVLESATFKGKPFEQVPKNMKLVFEKDTMNMVVDGRERGMPQTYDLDLKKDRNLLTIRTESTEKNGKKSTTEQQTVYELKGDVLNFYAGGPNQPAPASLKDAKETMPLLRPSSRAEVINPFRRSSPVSG